MRKRFAAGTAAAAVLLTPVAALAQEVVVEPIEAAVGETVSLRGAGCPAGRVDFSLVPEVGDPLPFLGDPVVADAQGAFEAPELIVPEADPGEFDVVAECGTERFEVPFTLLAATGEAPTTETPTTETPAATPSPTAGSTDTSTTTGSSTDTSTGSTDDQVQAPAGGVAAGGGGGAEGPALALAAGGLMLIAGAGLATRAARARG